VTLYLIVGVTVLYVLVDHVRQRGDVRTPDWTPDERQSPRDESDLT
jgi:hypothetical protein